MRRLIAAIALLAPAGCISVAETRVATPACAMGEPMVETTLYLGLLKPGGSVSRFDFAQFVEREVAPRWAEGFTLLEGQGLWQSEQRGITEREPSRLLIRLHDGSVDSSDEIEAIRNAYIAAFQQDAVLRTDRQTCASF